MRMQTIAIKKERPTSWWLAALKRRAERMYTERLDLSRPVEWRSERERLAAIRFFNAAYRAEESGLTQAHALADEVGAWDPDLAECLRLYGNEEGWHRELLTEFLGFIGGEIRPMGRITSTFYKLYGRAERMESIVLTNLMFETIGATTYRMALGRVDHPAVRQMLVILTRDESFHVPLNVHFLRQVLRRTAPSARRRLQGLYAWPAPSIPSPSATCRPPTPSSSGGCSSTSPTCSCSRRAPCCACSACAATSWPATARPRR
jgi:hypothetical protein